MNSLPNLTAVYTAAYLTGHDGLAREGRKWRRHLSIQHRMPVARVVDLESAITINISSCYSREHWELSDPCQPNNTHSICRWEREIRVRHKALV